ncbi:MAG: hypothetical protein VYE26_04525, partial [Pseudomonadota bacterium]|nr:hypothetical protein [Pseudomonadota bacterium]
VPDFSEFDPELVALLTELMNNEMMGDEIDFEDIMGDENITSACTWMNTLLTTQADDACLSDCDEQNLKELDFFGYMCAGCLEADIQDGTTGHCESWIGGDNYCEVYDDDLDACDNSPSCEVHEFYNQMTGFDEMECNTIDTDCEDFMYSTPSTCDEAAGCYWDATKEKCEYGAPICFEDCPGIYEIDPGEDIDGFCDWVTTTDLNNCTMDCDPYFLQHMESWLYMCEGCMNSSENDCNFWFSMLDDDHDNDPHDEDHDNYQDCQQLGASGNIEECHNAHNCYWDGYWDYCFDHSFDWEYFWHHPDCGWGFLNQPDKCDWAGCIWDESANDCMSADCNAFNSPTSDPNGCQQSNGCWWDGWLNYCFEEGFNFEQDFNCYHESLNNPNKCEQSGCTWENNMCFGEMPSHSDDDHDD